MEDYLGPEAVIHGQPWGTFHGGYFSDPAIARPLVETAAHILAQSPADAIVDLGGGTGFLLSQLALHGAGADAAWVDIDCSETQLSSTDGNRIVRICKSIGHFTRGDIPSGEKRMFLLMRSVLHYVGDDGLLPLLHHLRDQSKEGEFFVHQTASFDTDEEAVCINTLYRHMRTRKWYPTVNDLTRRLADAAWRVTATIPAPPLRLTSDDLGQRYALDAREIAHIRDLMVHEFGEANRVFQVTSSGFHASLDYRIYTCAAAR